MSCNIEWLFLLQAMFASVIKPIDVSLVVFLDEDIIGDTVIVPVVLIGELVCVGSFRKDDKS